jgi:hypothetical protein
VLSNVPGELQRNLEEKITSAFSCIAGILKELLYLPAISAGFQLNIRRGFQTNDKGSDTRKQQSFEEMLLQPGFS